MNLSNLLPTLTKASKRRGRGYGSGKGGHTSGRGAKGQKSRSKVPLYFEGTPMRKSLIRRLPMLRGKLRFKSFQSQPITLTLNQLNTFKAGTTVTLDSLIKAGLIQEKDQYHRIKVLNTGKLTKALKVSISATAGATKSIKKAGGEVIEPKVEPVSTTTKTNKN